MSIKYNEYLEDHINGVRKGYQWLEEKFPDYISKLMGPYASNPMSLLSMHDQSKYGDEEYIAYDRYFYGNKSFKVVQDFNYAWLHHIHRNPHHWQYWILVHDDEPEEILEMPTWYVVEMICDWWSFSWKSGNLHEIFEWYEKHKGMKLNPKTREVVEDILGKIKEELGREEEA